MAKIVFNEGVAINVEVPDNEQATAKAQSFINGVLDDNRFKQVFSEELEGGYAISGLAIVPNFDPVTQRLQFTYCSADNFVPLNGNTSTVSEAAILNHYRNVEKGVL
ncbi:hypothetical protein ACSFB5_12020, partial [Glaesserella parasuis]|uniref:hypothetical protein n=1 Tax=Glaesserella parasuis TaxID=738 RepID=UPI003F3810F4